MKHSLHLAAIIAASACSIFVAVKAVALLELYLNTTLQLRVPVNLYGFLNIALFGGIVGAGYSLLKKLKRHDSAS